MDTLNRSTPEREALEQIEAMTDAVLASGHRGPELAGLIKEDTDARFRAVWASLGRPGTFEDFCAEVMDQ
jgi:hypothetical protein